ncbi:M23/M56 family metallopeptidase [Youxingia wuxianensis]|uniref:Peptidoglycan DD-metalloendopeptidase family protein n=1 Tax=Youxingia wuxianensis TaxID=2763678 RepID=A0A926ELJ8_9FIRM|nr:M23/M56 family metallopeptidase [Youxingia wuxianensis]MBC8584108.1 peptidoglycan DD-metalloendopeptidase family protein [Youxingia wuxianensis]
MKLFFFEHLLPLSFSGAGVVFVILLLLPLTRKMFSNTWHYYLWSVPLVIFAIPFSLPVEALLWWNKTTGSPVSEALPPIIMQMQELMEVPLSCSVRPVIDGRQLTAFLWLAGVFLFFGYKFWSWARFCYQLRKNRRCFDDSQILAIFEQVKQTKHIKRKIPLYYSDKVGTPMLIGILFPKIILPKASLSPEEFTMVFLHELTHYSRCDLIYKLAALLVNGFHWFNPLAYVAAGQINRLCELSCDEALVKTMDPLQRKDYGKAILNVLQETKVKTPSVSSSFSLGKQDLIRRLHLIMDFKKTKKIILAGGICTIVLITFVGASLSSAISLQSSKPDNPSLVDQAYVSVPDLTGISLAEAQKVLSDLGLKLNYSETSAGGVTVAISQEPAAGSQLLAGGVVKAYFSEPEAQPSPETPPIELYDGEKLDISLLIPVSGHVSAQVNAYPGHSGTDIIAPEGTDITAAADGTVIYSDFTTGYGNCVILDHGNGIRTVYGHCKELLVSVDDTPAQGEVIATVGKTGLATGNHCHFELRYNDQYVDPTPYFN